MKRVTVGLVSVVLILGLVGTAGAFSGSGSGTAGDPYIITDVNQLQEMQSGLSAWYELGNDVNASDTMNWNAGDGFVPVGDDSFPFAGHLDGNGFTISGLYIDRSTTYVGLFGKIDEATVKNVCLVNADIEGGSHYTGGLVGYSYDSIIGYCDCAGSVKGTQHVGGLVGCSYYCEIAYCHSAATVVGTENVGGLVGYSDNDITRCSSTANVTGGSYVGGLIGYNCYGDIIHCYSTADVNGESYVGGLVGYSYSGSSITESFSFATVIGSVDAAGGLVGYNSSSSVYNCFATGSVSGGNLVGGLIGHNAGTITDSYSATIVSGATNVGGLVGYNTGTCNQGFWDTETSGQPSSACGAEKSTEEMKTEATFDAAGWNFVTIWNIQSSTYPCLKEVGPIGDLNYDCHVDFQDFALMASHWLESTPGI